MTSIFLFPYISKLIISSSCSSKHHISFKALKTMQVTNLRDSACQSKTEEGTFSLIIVPKKMPFQSIPGDLRVLCFNSSEVLCLECQLNDVSDRKMKSSNLFNTQFKNDLIWPLQLARNFVTLREGICLNYLIFKKKIPGSFFNITVH